MRYLRWDEWLYGVLTVAAAVLLAVMGNPMAAMWAAVAAGWWYIAMRYETLHRMMDEQMAEDERLAEFIRTQRRVAHWQ